MTRKETKWGAGGGLASPCRARVFTHGLRGRSLPRNHPPHPPPAKELVAEMTIAALDVPRRQIRR